MIDQSGDGSVSSVLIISGAKPIIPVCVANREGDHAKGVVVGSSLTVVFQLDSMIIKSCQLQGK